MTGAVTILGVVFVTLALLLRQAPGTAVDIAITRSLQRIDSPPFTALMVAISAPGYPPLSWLLLGGAGLILVALRLWRESLFVLVTVGADLLTTYAKLLVARPRPDDDLVRVVSHLQDFSYPSGHVVGYVSQYGFLFFLLYVLARPSWWRTIGLTVLGLLIATVGISRVHLGYHWASDVIGGYAIGTAYLLVSIEVYRALVTSRRPVRIDAPGGDRPKGSPPTVLRS